MDSFFKRQGPNFIIEYGPQFHFLWGSIFCECVRACMHVCARHLCDMHFQGMSDNIYGFLKTTLSFVYLLSSDISTCSQGVLPV